MKKKDFEKIEIIARRFLESRDFDRALCVAELNREIEIAPLTGKRKYCDAWGIMRDLIQNERI
jgi:hypothetical protein